MKNITYSNEVVYAVKDCPQRFVNISVWGTNKSIIKAIKLVSILLFHLGPNYLQIFRYSYLRCSGLIMNGLEFYNPLNCGLSCAHGVTGWEKPAKNGHMVRVQQIGLIHVFMIVIQLLPMGLSNAPIKYDS